MQNYTWPTRAPLLIALAAALIFTPGCGTGPKSSSPNTYVYVSQFYQTPPLTGLVRGAFAQIRVGGDGALTEILPTSLDVSNLPLDLAVDPSGRYLLATSNMGTIDEFIIGSDGTLTANSAATVTTDGSPEPLAFTPDGRFVVVADDWLNTVSSYSFSQAGTMSLINTVNTGNFPEFVAVDRSGKFLYVTSGNDNLLSEYTISPSGTLARVGSISAGGSNPTGLAVSPQGFVYSAIAFPPAITEFSIDRSTGALAVVGTLSGISQPWQITFDPSGAYAYVGTHDPSVSQYKVDESTGVLIPSGPDLAGVNTIVIDPFGKTAFAYSGPDELSSFTIGTDGRLNPAGVIDLGNPSLAQRIAVARH